MLVAYEFELDAFYRTIAPYYDGDYEGLFNGEDVAFYRGLAEAAPGPVLEMGCGTGRVLLPLAKAGVTMYGMDQSLAMLKQLCDRLQREDSAVRERVTVVHGDIRWADAGRFPLIIAACNVLHSFPERRDQRAWLRNVRRHLTPGGAFCFDVFQFEYERLLIPANTWNLQFDRTDPASGHRTRRYYRCDHEPELQRFRLEFRWVVEDADGKGLSDESASVMQRWYTRGELENLLELEGFEIADYWGGFGQEPFDRGSRVQIVRAIVP
jgi:SAM-dependent methyltransferase